MNRKNNSKNTSPLLTTLYCRLSLEDGKDNESMSNQKLLLKDYAEKNGMFNCEFYVDNGFTGRNFNRLAYQRMINDIEAGRISCVITKDLSRLGRNYIESGSYMEVFFPKHNVRYIAVTDNYDSLNKQELDIALYSRDISKKVLAGRMTRSRQGKFCGGQPSLGLMCDPDDNGHLIIDPETVPIIRRIYDLALDGFRNMKICKVLMEERIPITRMQTGTDYDVNYYAWSGSRISTILRNPFYKGAHVVCKTHQKGIRSNTYNIIPKEQREVCGGSMETYVDDYGNLYISVQRTIIKDKLTDMESEIMVYGFNQSAKNYIAVYYGTPDNCKLIWEQGDNLPIADQ